MNIEEQLATMVATYLEGGLHQGSVSSRDYDMVNGHVTDASSAT